MFCARPSMALATHCSASRCCCCSYCCCSLCRQVFPHFPRLLHTLLLVCFPFAGTKRRMRNLLTVAAAAARGCCCCCSRATLTAKTFQFRSPQHGSAPRIFGQPAPSPFPLLRGKPALRAACNMAKSQAIKANAAGGLCNRADRGFTASVCVYTKLKKKEKREGDGKSSCSKRRLTKLFKYLIAIN